MREILPEKMSYGAWRLGECNAEVSLDDDNCLHVEMVYPRSEGHIDSIQVGITDVRAADSILIKYDFARDGWSILQASKFKWKADDPICDPDWQEVAFVQAWAREDSE